jgi:hypothetical protein
MSKKTMAIARAAGVIGAVSALTVGITFANLTAPPVTLTNNTIASATAALEISGSAGVTYGTTATGFTINNVVPGSGYSGEGVFHLRNVGGVNLNITAEVDPDAAPSGTVNKSKVHLKFREYQSGLPTGSEVLTTLAALESGPVPMPNNPLGAGNTRQYRVNVAIDIDAITGAGASLDNFTFVFTGTQPTP